METLEDEIPNVDLSDAENIRPYQFEPSHGKLKGSY